MSIVDNLMLLVKQKIKSHWAKFEHLKGGNLIVLLLTDMELSMFRSSNLLQEKGMNLAFSSHLPSTPFRSSILKKKMVFLFCLTKSLFSKRGVNEKKGKSTTLNHFFAIMENSDFYVMFANTLTKNKQTLHGKTLVTRNN